MSDSHTPEALALAGNGARRIVLWCRDVIGEALDDSLGPEADRDAEPTAAARAIESLSLSFARLGGGAEEEAQVFRLAADVRPRVLWEALERLSHAVSGEDWAAATRPLMGLDAVHAERGALRHWAPVRRAIACRRLGLLCAPEISGALRGVMMDGPGIVTFTAALTLSRWADLPSLQWLLDHPEATSRRRRDQLAALVRRFGPDGAASVRERLAGWTISAPIHLAAVDALGMWHDRAASPLLVAVLRDSTIEGRTAAARALGGAGDADAIDALESALDDAAWPVRAQAARALGRLGAERSIPALSMLLRDRAWWVRRHSAFALTALGATGVQALRQIAAQDTDAFAAEMAGEALELGPHVLEGAGDLDDVA